MLYNCDAAGLPIATVNALGSVHDEDEMHCNVLVRHRDRPKLSRMYEELLGASGRRPRYARRQRDLPQFHVEATDRRHAGRGRAAARTITAAWTSHFCTTWSRAKPRRRGSRFRRPATLPDLLDHVPARWSYRRVTAEDELKATNYLACPRQPAAGWAYLDAVADVVRRQSQQSPSEHMLPARQISFQDQGLKAMFDEVHGLAEWVATYDDLLDKRQLAAQGINVIRYRRQRTHGRNMIVSSTSELRHSASPRAAAA